MRKVIWGFLIFMLVIFYWAHSTPEKAIRTHIIFSGHPIKGAQTTIFKGGIDFSYGQLYYTKDPEIYPNDWNYSVKKGLLGMWYINLAGTGRG